MHLWRAQFHVRPFEIVDINPYALDILVPPALADDGEADGSDKEKHGQAGGAASSERTKRLFNRFEKSTYKQTIKLADRRTVLKSRGFDSWKRHRSYP